MFLADDETKHVLLLNYNASFLDYAPIPILYIKIEPGMTRKADGRYRPRGKSDAFPRYKIGHVTVVMFSGREIHSVKYYTLHSSLHFKLP